MKTYLFALPLILFFCKNLEAISRNAKSSNTVEISNKHSKRNELVKSQSTVLADTISKERHITFKIHYSELYAAYDFLTRISENYPDNKLKSIFNSSIYNTPVYQKQVSDLQRLRVDYSYFFDQYPPLTKSGLMSRDLLERNLTLSNNISDFQSRSLGMLPNEDLTELCQIIEAFAGIYRELVFEPNKVAIKEQLKAYQAYIDGGMFEKYFKNGLTFYGVRWDNKIPFELCLLPSFEKNIFNARAFLNVGVCETPIDLKDHRVLLSVAMHEIFHIIYDNQVLSTKSAITKHFENTNSPNSQYALLLMNEVLATVLGNGYVMEDLTGQIDQEDWYVNKYVNSMAKQAYPLVKEYVLNSREIDEAFVKEYVDLYDTKFSRWGKELDHLFAYRYITADDPSDLKYFRSKYRKYSYSRMGSPIGAGETEKISGLPLTKVFIISKNHNAIITLIQKNFPETTNLKLNFNREFISVVKLKDRTQLFIINRYTSTVGDLMDKYFPQNLIVN